MQGGGKNGDGCPMFHRPPIFSGTRTSGVETVNTSTPVRSNIHRYHPVFLWRFLPVAEHTWVLGTFHLRYQITVDSLRSRRCSWMRLDPCCNQISVWFRILRERVPGSHGAGLHEIYRKKLQQRSRCILLARIGSSTSITYWVVIDQAEKRCIYL